MKRIILDTNVYEFLLKYVDKEMLKGILTRNIIVVYGLDLIRKELRDIPKNIKEDVDGRARSLRNTLLILYDTTIGKHYYQTTSQMLEIADKYFIVYKTLGGKSQKREVAADFTIVACASLHNLDVVVSEDIKTMLSEPAIKSYKVVNLLYGFRTPDFIQFNDFKNKLRGGRFD